MKTKTISIDKKQFESLLRAVAIVGSIYGVMGDMVDKKYKKQASNLEDVKNLLAEHAPGFDLDEVVEEFDGGLSIDMSSKWYDEVMKGVSDYQEYMTYMTLSNKLGWRDFFAKYSKEEIKKLQQKHGDYMGVPLYDFENRYYKEFDKYEYDRLYVDENRK